MSREIYLKARGTQLVLAGIGIGSCVLGVAVISACVVPIVGIMQSENASRCHPPAGGFSSATLAGTWMAGVPSHIDTLIIRPDGTYKQSVHIEYTDLPPTDYESDWQLWRLEYSQANIPYLHLTGYAFCGMNAAIPCGKRDAGGYDFCQDKYLNMNGEGILVVLEAYQEKPSGGGRQYSYHLFYPLGSENSYAYSLQQP